MIYSTTGMCSVLPLATSLSLDDVPVCVLASGFELHELHPYWCGVSGNGERALFDMIFVLFDEEAC